MSATPHPLTTRCRSEQHKLKITTTSNQEPGRSQPLTTPGPIPISRPADHESALPGRPGRGTKADYKGDSSPPSSPSFDLVSPIAAFELADVTTKPDFQVPKTPNLTTSNAFRLGKGQGQIPGRPRRPDAAPVILPYAQLPLSTRPPSPFMRELS